MVKTRGAHSKKTPSSHGKRGSEVSGDSVPAYVATVPPSVSAPSTSGGVRHKAKPRKQTTPVPTDTALVFPDVEATVPEQSPPTERVVAEADVAPPPAKSSPTTRSKATEKGTVTPVSVKKTPVQSKKMAKGYLKRKTPSDSAATPLSSVKKRLKDNPPSPTPSDDVEEDDTVVEETVDTVQTTEVSDKDQPQETDASDTESEPLEDEEVDSSDTDVAPSPPPVVTAPSSVGTKGDTKGKGKKSSSKSTAPSAKSVVKSNAHSHTFYYNDNERDMQLYANRKFLAEKNFVLGDHRSFGVLIILQTREWVGSVVKLSGYVDRVVKEFYANLTHDVIDPNSPHFEKVYVRGRWYSFAPKEVAFALQIPVATVEDQNDILDRDEVLSELVGQRMQWSPNTVLQVTNLTNLYAVLHRFATTNWKPTSHTNTISFDLAAFLYKVGTGLSVDLAKHMFDQIVGFRKGNRKSLNLPFPHLVYKILSMQNEEIKLDHEELVPATTATSFRPVGPSHETGDAPSAKKVKPQPLKFASEDLPSGSVPTEASDAATEFAFLRSSLADLHVKVALIQQNVHDLMARQSNN